VIKSILGHPYGLLLSLP